MSLSRRALACIRGPHPLHALLRFIVCGFAVLFASRLLLVFWQWPRASAAGPWPVFLGGLRIDVSLLAIIALPVVVLAPWCTGPSRAAQISRRLQTIWLTAFFALLTLLEVVTPSFIEEYDLRPNRLFFEYLGSPKEVFRTLWASERGALLLAALLCLAAGCIGWRLFRVTTGNVLWWARVLWSAGGFLCFLLAARGGLQHRPINPALVAFSDDPLVNSLALDSLYSVAFEAYSLRHEDVSSEIYGRLPEAQMNALVRASAGFEGSPLEPRLPSLHHQRPAVARARPVNLVLIVEESLGARFVESLGGLDLAPNLDRLSSLGWWFTNFYATGTRSARGLEAIVTGFPPSPARAVLKLDRAQHGFFTLAGLLRQFGYETCFVYGGEGHFDNMQGFFLNNGFHEAVDGSDFEDPVFRGTWGVSDEDVFARAHQMLLAAGGKPIFLLIFSASNHNPWEFPDGRIELAEEPKATMHNSVKYADWALGQFVDQALAAPYAEHSLIAIVADHDARVHGAELVPIEHFRIPALILGPGVPARVDPRLASQIDLAPTLLSLMGIESTHPMIGRDLLEPRGGDPGRALLQYDNNYAYCRGDDAVILQPGHEPLEFHVAGGALEPEALDAELGRTALAHALWSSWAYREERYPQVDQGEILASHPAGHP